MKNRQIPPPKKKTIKTFLQTHLWAPQRERTDEEREAKTRYHCTKLKSEMQPEREITPLYSFIHFEKT